MTFLLLDCYIQAALFHNHEEHDLSEQLLEGTLVNITLQSLLHSTPFRHTPPAGQLRIAPGSEDLSWVCGSHQPHCLLLTYPQCPTLVHIFSSLLPCSAPASPYIDHPRNYVQQKHADTLHVKSLRIPILSQIPQKHSMAP